jgi:opacity protein-like surface antigen
MRRVILALCLVLAIFSPAALFGKEFKVVFSVGANFRPQPGYAYDYSRKMNPGNPFYPAEYARGTDRVSKAKTYAPELGLGLSYGPIALSVSASAFTERFLGTYGLVVPSMYAYDLIASDTHAAESKFTGTVLAATLTYSVPLGRTLRAYAGAGAHFLWTKIEVMEDLIYTETYDRIPGIGFANHTVDITDVVFSEVKLNVPSWSAVAGLELAPAGDYRIFIEGRYRAGRREFPHPYYLRVGNVDAPITLDFSGFVLSFGIRFGLEI